MRKLSAFWHLMKFGYWPEEESEAGFPKLLSVRERLEGAEPLDYDPPTRRSHQHS